MKKKAIVVTGAGGGIGSELVARLSADYFVFATDKFFKKKPKFFLQADLSNSTECENLIGEIQDVLRKRKLRLTGVINNAALQRLSPLDVLTFDDWEESFRVNVIAAWKISVGLLKHLKKSDGCVLNVGSIHSKLTKKNFAAYAASKAALNSLTRSMAIEWGASCRVYGIAPAAIATPMLKQGFKDSNRLKQFYALAKYHPTQCLGTREEVAELCKFLMDKGSRFLNGSIISFDGGIGSVLHDPA